MDNGKLIDDFLLELNSVGLSANRVKKYKSQLHTLSNLLGKDFKGTSKDDLIRLFADMQQGKTNSSKGKAYSENTKRDFKISAKKFWRWMKPQADEKSYPKEVSWIKTSENGRLKKIIKTKDVLTEEEVYEMVDASPHARDKAIISLLYESGSRIGEIEFLKISDIIFDDKGYSFETTTGKTGQHYKRVMNQKAVQYLKEWLSQHPMKDDNDAPLWVTLSRARHGIKQLNQSGIRKFIKEIAEVAGIKKATNPHSFRHARITNLRVVRGINDSIIESLVGWKPGSDMFGTYQHSKSRDIDEALAKAYAGESTENKLTWFKVCTVFVRELMKETEKNPELLKNLDPAWQKTLDEIPKEVKMSLFFKRVRKDG